MARLQLHDTPPPRTLTLTVTRYPPPPRTLTLTVTRYPPSPAHLHSQSQLHDTPPPPAHLHLQFHDTPSPPPAHLHLQLHDTPPRTLTLAVTRYPPPPAHLHLQLHETPPPPLPLQRPVSYPILDRIPSSRFQLQIRTRQLPLTGVSTPLTVPELNILTTATSR